MTDHEITYLVIGLAFGWQGAHVLHAYWASRDACRAVTASQAALKRATGDRLLNSLRLYQLQQRMEARR